MALETYRQKRDFKTTSEPRGRRSRKRGNSFVVQKHAATRLHYDLRLEMNGVLKSWAVTRGPSLVANEKRLAVHVEDHPLDYGDFEGAIPKGEYGGGTVIVWDRGQWSPIGDAAKGYAKGHLEFELTGEKLKGRWHLVRMQEKPRDKHENWLLIKADDIFARPESAPDILSEQPLSVKTGRDIPEVAGAAAPTKSRRKPAIPKPEETDFVAPDLTELKGSRKAPLPDFIAPMLATLANSAPTGRLWLHEIKFDGYRLQARIAKGQLRLLTRSDHDWTEKFGSNITDALKALPVQDAILDGELVVETDTGASDFSALQADLAEGRADRFRFYAFDLMHLDGFDLRALPLVERKALLEQILTEAPEPLRYSSHFDESGTMVLRHACRIGLEGILSKQRDGPYRSGRGKGWIKSKCSERQEFVIGGFTPSRAAPGAIGSLVLGVHDPGGLRHVGRVGTGFSNRMATDLFTRLTGMQQTDSPFADRLTRQQADSIRFVRPELVAEVEFGAWTAKGHLRHAAFRGLREDKPAAEIIREDAAPAKPAPAKRNVTLTHPDRLYWPEEGITKEMLADYYAEIWRYIAPFVTNRPLALLRCPEGITGPKFFQKHAWKGLNPRIAMVSDPKDPNDPLLSIHDLDGLMALVQSAALEIHPWGAGLQDWERPDMITMDLDPGEGVGWDSIADAAREVRQRLTDAGMTAFVKTSGGKGLHVVAPLKPHATWPEVKALTKAMADAMARDTPDRYVSTIAKAKRKGRILIDYLRNQRGATAVAAYSTRARPGAAVSTPVAWEELAEIGPDHFTVKTLPNRLAGQNRDPWQGFRAAAVPLKLAKP